MREDKSRVIVTTDKGLVMEVMNKKYYIQKVEELLGHKQTYRTITADPATRQNKRLMNLYKDIKAEGGIHNHTYRKLYPTGTGSPKFYGLLKIHKTLVPCGP